MDHDHDMTDNASDIPTAVNGSSGAASPRLDWTEDRSGKVIIVGGARTGGEEATAQDGTAGLSEQNKQTRYRPRTFPYQRYLPYEHKDRYEENLAECVKRLYIAVSAGDFVPGATHWTRELRGWLQLKFDLPTELRVKLVKLYYELAVAPGMEPSAGERFASMFMTLMKKKHYLKAGQDIYLDWRPLFKELKSLVLPSDTGSVLSASSGHLKRNSRTMLKLCSFAQLYFDPSETQEMLNCFLPYFSTSSPENAFAVVGLTNLLLPTFAAPQPHCQPQDYMPALFHVWSLMNRSKHFDMQFIDYFSRLARDVLPAEHVEYTAYGVFTEPQASMIFTSILRLLEIPVSQVTSPYSGTVDVWLGLAVLLERDQRKHPMAHHIARWIVMSLSPACATEPDSILTKLEGLIQAVETFFHPSNHGNWSRSLAQLVFYLADFFVMRWNRERSGEMSVPKERRLNEAVRRRFVLCLRDVTFMGIFAKSGTAMSYSLSSLQSLALLEPSLILPGALQRIYPSMQGSVEVHRTSSSIKALHELTKTMVKTKGFRCHVTSLLGLALPGIDANDLPKTMNTLAYMQAVFYNLPMHDLTAQSKQEVEADVPKLDGMLAAQWVSAEIERLDKEGVGIEINYEEELSAEDEMAVLRSSTSEFHTFVDAFLERVFNLLRNLPDAAKIKTGSPEENVANTLPATFTPFFSSMSPELYDLALQKISDFVSKHVVYQARDATAFICSALCKVNPKKALGILVPILIRGIRTEIDDNAAGSTRTSGQEVLPRDRALIWNVSLLSMCLVHVGSAIMDFEQELMDIAQYLQQKCRGMASIHASNLVHHILLTLTMTYTVDYSLYEESDLVHGVTPELWGRTQDPQTLNIKWHHSDSREIDFAVKLFKHFAESESERLRRLTSDQSPVKRDGAGKDWSDEVQRSLVLLRLITSGVSSLFDPLHNESATSTVSTEEVDMADGAVEYDDVDDDVDTEEESEEPTDADYGGSEEDSVRPTYQYATGYHLTKGDEQYESLHQTRQAIGTTLHDVHVFLAEKQQDDVTAFSALYTAYRSWFTDLGIERSAHVLDRVTRLFAADIAHFKVSGLRKEYPRPLLVRRANVYHLQRLRHNASPRKKTDLDLALLRDLIDSCVSSYTEIRRTAQSGIESAIKVLIGVRPAIIPPLLEIWQAAIKSNDFPRIKGAMFTLLFGSLTKAIGRDWRFTPSMIKSFLDVLDTDKPSIQKICAASTLQVMDVTRMPPRMTILAPEVVDAVYERSPEDYTDAQSKITKRKKAIQKRKDFVRSQRSNLADELAQTVGKAHWKKESRTAAIVVGLSLRWEDITSSKMAEIVVQKAIDPHPTLRALYGSALIGIFTYIDMRAVANHSYEEMLLEKKHVPGLVKKEFDSEDPDYTKKFLASFSAPEADAYVDHDHPGWLVWTKDYSAFKSSDNNLLQYDDVEQTLRSHIGSHIDRQWLSTCFAYMKQEPRDQHADRFRTTSVILLTQVFNLTMLKQTKINRPEIQELIMEVFGDGSDKHAHRATAEILGALLNAAVPLDLKERNEIWSFVFPLVRGIFENALNVENMGYWTTFLDFVIQNKDPRRSWPMIEWLASFRLNMSSNAAFKETSKISLLEHSILDLGWHFQLEKPILEDFLAHLDHPYKGVREVMGLTIASIYRTQYHESYKDVATLLTSEKAASSLGSRPYKPTEEFGNTLTEVFDKIEKWRGERPAGLQTPSSYTMASKTVLAWLEHALCSFSCTEYLPFFPTTFLEPLLHMMDIKEDPDLQALAYSVFRHLGNIPYRSGEEGPFVDALIRIGRTATSWHQRLRVMINIQAIYFRHLFLMPRTRQLALFDCIASMLHDTQIEVRVGASTTLSGMIRCSPISLRTEVITDLCAKFTDLLAKNPLPKKRGPGTPTPDQNKLVLTRHAAVLGLGALVQAFPYTSPPPSWVPQVLATLALKAAGDPGVVGKSAKSIVSDFKKTRQDTWHIDIKVSFVLDAEFVGACANE